MTKYKNEIEDLSRYLDDNDIRRITKSTVSELEEAGFDAGTLNTLRQNINDGIGRFGQIKIGSSAEKQVADMQVPEYSPKLQQALMTAYAIKTNDFSSPLLKEWVEEREITKPGIAGKDGSELKADEKEIIKALPIDVMSRFTEKYGSDVFEEIGVGYKELNSTNDIDEVIEKADWRATPLTLPTPEEDESSGSVEEHLLEFRKMAGLNKDGSMNDWKPTHSDEVEEMKNDHLAAMEGINAELESIKVSDSPTLPSVKLPKIRKAEDAADMISDLTAEANKRVRKGKKSLSRKLDKAFNEPKPTKLVRDKGGPMSKAEIMSRRSDKGPVMSDKHQGLNAADFIKGYLDGDMSWPTSYKPGGPYKQDKPKTKETETTVGGGGLAIKNSQVMTDKERQNNYVVDSIPPNVLKRLQKKNNQPVPIPEVPTTLAQDVEERLKRAGTGKADPSIEMTPKYGKIKS